MMLSNDQNVTPNSQNSNCPPKRFLRKGEGLKRFAAYKPPLPTTVKKAERRKTFVKFNLDNQKSSSQRPPLHFLPPEILNDDSINLSTEIPKIAPPKIIHTPIRPNRQALGAITNRCPDQDESSLFNESRINGNIDSLFRKIEHKKSLLEHDNQEFIDSFIDSPIENSGQQARKQISCTKNESTKSTKQSRPKHLDIDIETDDSACGSNSPTFSKPINNTKKVSPKFDLSIPTSGSCVLALNKRIQQIEFTMNALKVKIEKCECGMSKSPESQHPPTTQVNTRSRRPLTRAAAKAAKSQPSTNSDNATKSTSSSNDDKNNRPSALADNCNSTKKVLNTLVREISELKSQINTLKLSD